MTERPITAHLRDRPAISPDIQFILVFCSIGFLLALILMLLFPDFSGVIALPD